MNTLRQLEQSGQAPWLDFVSRRQIESGELRRLIEEDGLKGMTSNPSLFEKDIAETGAYDQDLRNLLSAGDQSVGAIYERLAIDEIRRGADALWPVYGASGGEDGFISLEVSPYLAHDTQATIAEARRLWRAVDRANLMIKVPGTEAGMPAIRQLLMEGININITLLFGLEAYRKVVEAYLSALEERVGSGRPVDHIASVASFFISRIDTAVDRCLEDAIAGGGDRAALEALRGKVAIANAKLAYARFRSLFSGPRWERLAAAGARPQRLLWASTSTKNPALPDTLYVEALVGPDTIDTMPPATLAAFRDHGRVVPNAVESDLAGASATVAELAKHGILLRDVADMLVGEGVQQFAAAFDRLLGVVAQRRAALRGDALAHFDAGAAAAADAVGRELDSWQRAGNIRKLWRRDAALWTGRDENRWLGWLDIIDREQDALPRLKAFSDWVRAQSFTDVCLIGMGGSSLGPEVLAALPGRAPGWPRLHIMDSTDPRQIEATEQSLDLARTLFIVASKSGTTLEPDILHRYFFERAAQRVAHPGAHFVAVTDPGSALEAQARAADFAQVFHGVPSIGGRYSVLSAFGLVPAAAIGIDTGALLRATRSMVFSCGVDVPPAHNPGVQLGVILGVLARDFARDKVTVLAPPALAVFGAWLEQLLAESTGKQGRGLIPIVGEAPGAAAVYGDDRVFVQLAPADVIDSAPPALPAALTAAGHPVVRIAVDMQNAIGQEFFRWEIAVAAAGAVLGINPFDQPDVEASKVKTRALMSAYEQNRTLPAPQPLFEERGIALYADAANAAALGSHDSLAGYLKAHCARLRRGDYLALLAFIERNAAHEQSLQQVRTQLRDTLRVATCVGFGPRFLHSTGQLYKGGPDSGVFIQITCADARDIAVPGQRYTFGTVKAAQALGDLDVLNERGRRALRVHLQQPDSDLPRLLAALRRAAA